VLLLPIDDFNKMMGIEKQLAESAREIAIWGMRKN